VLNREESVTTSSEKELDLNERVFFWVGKKISKIIYLNGGRRAIRSKKCKVIAKLIEQNIRKRCKEVEQYKEKIRKLVFFFDKRPRRVKKFILKYS